MAKENLYALYKSVKKQFMKIIIEENKKTKKHIIIIPKKCVKLACRRNKIRRQIRAILQSLKAEPKFIKYLDREQKPRFKEVKSVILSSQLKPTKNNITKRC